MLTVPKVLSVDEITFLQSSISAKSALTKIHLEPIFSISSFTFNPWFSLRPQIVIPFAPLLANSFAVSAPIPWVLPVITMILSLNWFFVSVI